MKKDLGKKVMVGIAFFALLFAMIGGLIIMGLADAIWPTWGILNSEGVLLLALGLGILGTILACGIYTGIQKISRRFRKQTP